MGRRGRGEGSISQRADGRWIGRVDLGRGPTGKRQRKAVYGQTRAAVAAKLSALLGRAADGSLSHTTTPKLAAWMEEWYRTHQSDWRPGTQRVYRHAIDQWIVPALGGYRLDALKPLTVQRWANGHTGDGPRRMLTTALVVLRSALTWAMTQQLLTYNAASLVKVESPTAARPVPLTLPQAHALLAACDSHPLGGMVVISLLLGLRAGEVCGLTWADVGDGVIRVRQQIQPVAGKPPELCPLKTAHSRRTLALPAKVAAVLEARQSAPAHPWGLVFTRPSGACVTPEHVREVLEVIRVTAGLPPLRYHTLRHTCATLLLSDGTPLFDVSRILGHASIDITANLYGHLVPDMTAGAASRMDRLFGGSDAGRA